MSNTTPTPKQEIEERDFWARMKGKRPVRGSKRYKKHALEVAMTLEVLARRGGMLPWRPM